MRTLALGARRQRGGQVRDHGLASAGVIAPLPASAHRQCGGQVRDYGLASAGVAPFAVSARQTLNDPYPQVRRYRVEIDKR